MKYFKMFSLVVCLGLFVLSSIAFGQQWSGDNNTTSNIYRTGKVGIGTASPQEALHIESGNILVHANGIKEKGIYFRQGFTQSNIYNTSIFTYDHNGNFADGISINGYDGISFNTGSNNRNERMRITLNGNVGIGTTSPVERLHILRESVTNAHYLTTASVYEGAEGKFQIIASDAGASASQFLLTSAPSSGENKHWGFHHAGIDWGDRLDIGYGTSTGSGNFWNIPAKMSILTNGNVGIGTTSPIEKLDVSGRIISSELIEARGLSNPLSGKGLSIAYYAGTDKGYLRSRDWNTNTWKPIDYQGSGHYFLYGNVGIGTTNPQSELAVNGTITAKEVQVTLTGWSDFVFKKDYDLKSLQEVEDFINQNKHLPDIPSAKEVESNGVDLGEMQAKLLQKVEELTLYVIEQNKKLEQKESRINELETRLSKLEK